MRARLSHSRGRTPVRPQVEALETRLALSISAVPDTTTFPFSAVVEVDAVNKGQLLSASGVLIDGTHVLTAAHVLYDNGVLDSSVVVYPGRNGENVEPFGSARGTQLVVHPNYVSGPDAGTDAYDLGVITLDHNVGASTGAFGLLPLYPDSYFDAAGTIDILGYPADTFSGVNQYFSTGPAQAADSTEISWALRDVPIEHGSSGAPVYVKNGNTRTVVGIVSELSRNGGFATRLTADKYNWIISQIEPSVPASAQPPVAASQGPGVFDPSSGLWYLRDSNSPGTPDVAPFAYGAPGWKAVTGDWNNDGTTTAGVVDPATMTWYLKNSNTAGAPDYAPFAYGAPGWIPVTGDWDGNGTTTVGVFDPSTATWYLKNSNTGGAPDYTPFQYGAPGWIPVAGDWDGNGTVTIGVVDPTTMTWYLKNSNGPGAPDIAPFQYGAPGWTPIVGDWDGNRTTTVGAIDPTTMLWYLKNSNTFGAPDYLPFSYGAPGWQPVAGAWQGRGGAGRSSGAYLVPPGRNDLGVPAVLLDDRALLSVALAEQGAALPASKSGEERAGTLEAVPAPSDETGAGLFWRWDDQGPFDAFGGA